MSNSPKNGRNMLNGLIKRHPDGFGFFIPDDKEHPDVYIPAHSMKSAMTNDRATILVEKERDGRFRGDIVRITERAHRRIAGVLNLNSDKWATIKDEGRGWGRDLRIPLEKTKGAKTGDLVEATITQFPDEGQFEGEVLNVIGDAENPLNDVKRVVITQNIPEHFSAETLAEAKKYTKDPTQAEFKGRKDLRDLPIITIDGATAKDFDDAVYVEMTDSGFHLYVAIADVSHYVPVGSAMDKEAYERGTSVYFPNFVIPMLPENISNGLCSLNPHVPRLALVAEMNFDFTGVMTDSKFYEGVIESKARVTYGQAQELIDGTPMPQLDHVKENILKCADLAKVLMAKRFKEGSLDLEVPETELVIDGTGEPVDVIKSERLFAHRLIEELMLAANVAVAKFLGSKEIPSFYRIHEEPDSQKIANLQKYMENLGYRQQLGGGKLQKRLTRALQEFDGKPEAQIIHILTLRSMSQAKYTKNNLGHFGLGFDFYTHFTSPIRRYPDLIVHRLLKNQVMPNGPYRLMSDEDLSTAGTWLSACEQRAAKAERQIQAIKKARFMKKLLGDSFDGLISSITKFGVFVLLREFNIDGLIRLDDLGKEKFEFDEENLTLTAKRSGLTYKMGDVVRVTVSMVDVDQGQVNFVLDKDASAENRAAHGSDKTAQPHRDSDRTERKADHKDRTYARSKGDFKKKDFKKDFKSDDRSHQSSGKKSEDRPKKTFGKNASFAQKHSETPSRRDDSRSNERSSERSARSGSGYKSSNSTKTAAEIRFRNHRPDDAPVPSTPPSSGPDYKPQPRYASLSDYLDKRKEKGSSSNEEKSESQRPSRSAENRPNTEKRRPSSNNSNGVRKARSQKSRRTNKSR